MELIFSFFKRKALSWLPQPALQFVKKIHYARMLESFSLEEEPDLKIVQYLVKPGDHVVDIGANIGVYTKILSQLVGNNGRVYSIEAVPATFEILRSNLLKLHLENVEPINCAISDSSAVVTMEIPHYSSGGENYYQARIIRNDTSETKMRRVNTQSVTIDSKFCRISSKISFIKCDVEEHELACLRGAKNFLAQSQPAWLLEVSGDPDNPQSSAHQVFDMLSEKGYSSWWFDSTVLRRRHPGERNTNYFFLRDDHIITLKNREPKLFI